MFTGIITEVGRVRAMRRAGVGSDTRIEITAPGHAPTLVLGASIACSGPCLTVVEKGPGWFAVEASAETLARTSLGDWSAGTPVNLERSLAAGDEIGAHLVSGHVDAVVRVLARKEEGGSIRFEIELPPAQAPFVAAKGSVSLEGVSLTVNDVQRERFGINIIRHTAEQTTLGAMVAGGRLNMEVDMLARYVERQLTARFRG